MYRKYGLGLLSRFPRPRSRRLARKLKGFRWCLFCCHWRAITEDAHRKQRVEGLGYDLESCPPTRKN